MVHDKLSVLSPRPGRRSPWVSLPCDPGPAPQGHVSLRLCGGHPGWVTVLLWTGDLALLTPGSGPTVGCSCQGTHTLQAAGKTPPTSRALRELILATGGRRVAGTSHPGLCTTLSSFQLGHPGHGEDPNLQPCPKPYARRGP